VRTLSETYLNRQAAADYLLKQSDQVRNVIIQFQRIAITIRAITLLLICWFVFTNQLASISRSLFTQVGDGTVYFLTVDPVLVGMIMVFLSIPILACVEVCIRKVLFFFLEAYRDYISEYLNILVCQEQINKDSKLVLSKVLIFVLVLLIVMCTGNYTKITDKGMSFRRIWGGGEKSYSWEKIANIDSGYKLIPHPYHGYENQSYESYAQITFTDGETWTPLTCNHWQNDKVEDAVIYIRQKKEESITSKHSIEQSRH